MGMGIVKLWCTHSMELYAAVKKVRDGSTSGVLSTSQRSLREPVAPPTTKIIQSKFSTVLKLRNPILYELSGKDIHALLVRL